MAAGPVTFCGFQGVQAESADWRVSGKGIKGMRLSSDGSEHIILLNRDEGRMPSIYVTKDYTLSSGREAVPAENI